MSKKASKVAGQWICRRVAYEQSDELRARGGADDVEGPPPQSASKTEFAKAELAIASGGQFAVHAPAIAGEPIVTGTWQQKGKQLTAVAERLDYGQELVAMRMRNEMIEVAVRLNDDSYDSHDVLVLVFHRAGDGDQRALLDSLGSFELWEQAERLRDEIGDDGEISALLWGAFERGEWPPDGVSAGVLARFTDAATAAGVARFVHTQQPDPDVEIQALLACVPAGSEEAVAAAMTEIWLEDLAQSRMLAWSDLRFDGEVRAALLPQPAFDDVCRAYALRQDSNNLDAIRALTPDASASRIAALVQYTGPDRFQVLVDASAAVPREVATDVLSTALGSKVPHRVLNAVHALDAIGSEAPADKRAHAVHAVTTYVQFGRFTDRDFTAMKKLGVDASALRIAVTAD